MSNSTDKRKVIVCNHKGNHYIKRGARGYLQWALMATNYDNGDGDGLFGMDRPIHWYDWDEYVSVFSYWAGAIAP